MHAAASRTPTQRDLVPCEVDCGEWKQKPWKGQMQHRVKQPQDAACASLLKGGTCGRCNIKFSSRRTQWWGEWQVIKA